MRGLCLNRLTNGPYVHFASGVRSRLGYFSIARLLCQHKNSIFSKNLPHPGCAGVEQAQRQPQIYADHRIVLVKFHLLALRHIDLDPTAHAEVNCIRQATRKLKTFNLEGCEIYTSCEPCPMCLGAIYWAHLDRIYYANDRKDAAKIGFDDEFIYEEIDRKIEDRHKPMIALMRDEALGAFRMWEENAEKTEY